jgi:signal transduction histidine kinase
MNGVEAMQNGGKLTVRTQYLMETDEILMSVCDTGMGISPAILPYIFDPFVTNKKRGTGIGLTISHDIVLKHRGRLIAENNVITSGATFKVWLPVAGIPVEIE